MGIQWILSCEHGGNRVPARYRALFRGADAALASHRGWDPGSLALGRTFAQRLAAPLVTTQVTRLLIEVNRSLGHPRLYSEFSRGLDPIERRRLIGAHYSPHRQRVKTLVREAIAAGRRAVHIALHTFTPILDGVERDLDVGLLYDPRRRMEKRMCAAWRAELRRLRPDLRVGRNRPYRGQADGLTTALRRQFAPRSYVGIELEVNQRWVGRRSSWDRLRHDLAAALHPE